MNVRPAKGCPRLVAYRRSMDHPTNRNRHVLARRSLRGRLLTAFAVTELGPRFNLTSATRSRSVLPAAGPGYAVRQASPTLLTTSVRLGWLMTPARPPAKCRLCRSRNCSGCVLQFLFSPEPIYFW